MGSYKCSIPAPLFNVEADNVPAKKNSEKINIEQRGQGGKGVEY